MVKHQHNKRSTRSRNRNLATGRVVDGMAPEERNQLMVVLAATGLILLLAQFFGMIWFNAHPDAMNTPIIPAAYHMISLVILFFGGLALAVSLVLNRKSYVSWRVWGVIILWGLTVIAYIWWYRVLPYLYGA